MTYLDLVKAMSDRPVRLLTCATTGVKDDDTIIGICMANLEGNAHTLMVEGVPEDKLTASFQYHKITPEIYQISQKVSPLDMFKTLSSWSTTDVIFTYNAPFMKKMTLRLVNNEAERPINICDVANLYQWIRSGQIFADNVPHDYDQIIKEESSWQKNRAPGIRTILKDIASPWQESESKTTPENMIAALQSVFQWFGTKQVHSVSDSSESWEAR